MKEKRCIQDGVIKLGTESKVKIQLLKIQVFISNTSGLPLIKLSLLKKLFFDNLKQ